MDPVTDTNGSLVGWLHTHPDARGITSPCQSFCAVRALNGSPIYEVVHLDPLTLAPSLQCPTCGDHGNVVAGKWKAV